MYLEHALKRLDLFLKYRNAFQRCPKLISVVNLLRRKPVIQQRANIG